MFLPCDDYGFLEREMKALDRRRYIIEPASYSQSYIHQWLA
jgi:hypothetical protein